MDINGCHVVLSGFDAESPDGFVMTVSRYIDVRRMDQGIPVDAVRVDRGPFQGVIAARDYALSWDDAKNPPPMSEPVKKTDTVSEVKPKEPQFVPPGFERQTEVQADNRHGGESDPQNQNLPKGEPDSTETK